MKTFIQKLIYIAASAVLLASCEGWKPTPAPEFPEMEVVYIIESGSAEIQFTANQDWVLSIPAQMSAWFYLMDDGMPSFSIKGKAGEHRIRVYLKDIQNKDLLQCELTLTMGTESRVIATVVRDSATRIIDVYSAAHNEDGSFTPIGGGEYIYEEEKSSSLHLSWPDGFAGYFLPIKVEANFNWSVAQYPKWMEVSHTTSDGDVTFLTINGVAAYYPLEDAEDKIVFVDLRTGAKAFEITISIDGCKDVAFTNFHGEKIELSIPGQYYQNHSWNVDGCPVYLTGTPDSEIIPILKDGNGKLSYSADSWVRITAAETSSKDVVIDHLFHINSLWNTGAMREAVLLAVPGYKLKDIDRTTAFVNEDASAISAEFAEYEFATLVQAGSTGESEWLDVCPMNSEYVMGIYGGGISHMPTSDPRFYDLADTYGTDRVYVVSFNNWDSAEKIELAFPYANLSYAFIDAEGKESETDLNIEAEISQSGSCSVLRPSIAYFEDGYSVPMIVRSGASSITTLLLFEMSTAYWPEVDYRDIYFSNLDYATGEDDDILPQDVVLEEITSGDVYEQYKEYNIAVWRIAYYGESCRNAMIVVPPFPTNDPNAICIPDADRAWLSTDVGVTENDKVWIHAIVNEKSPELGKTSTIVLMGGGRPVFVLVVERQFI